ncbi:arabinosyltransferase domain-containing protein [Pseudonocardia sp. TRM90224]|uniref:arabinosyltransferase domain-containing protein n=1 Tax=Pseudonocardia sp. TRM90224 TaxID=2812678 RepID=UPI001E6241E8|nr:arabinosyltransferase domain-containing protein [Pseudonocardia sp. TRM90224]
MRVLVFGLVALVAAVAFPLAPVEQPVATYSWSATDGPAAIPLMPYQPARLEVRFECATLRGVQGTVFATVPRVVDPAAEPLAGLTITARDGSVQVTSAGVDLGAAPLPAGDCAATFTSDPARTALVVDGMPVVDRAGDLRPDVAGAFSDLSGAAVAATITTDTRFQTTISPLKLAIGVIALAALAGMLISLGRGERRVRLLPRGWWRPRPVDAAVAGVLAVWWVVGSATVDDGYIAGIVRSRGTNGLIGNLYRWLNAPEAPFSWVYELYHLWSLASPTAAWMRLPSTLLGLTCWWLLSRAVLPRITRHRWASWLAALAFAAWWVPFNLGLRPEPWVAVGALAVYAIVERAVATRRLRPLASALVVATATAAVTPGGLVAFAPFLASAVPLLRLLRLQRGLPLMAVLLAAPASALLLMAHDQSAAAIVEAIRVRAVIGGGLQWYEEFERYAALLAPLDFQGALGRRAAVLFTLLAAAGALLHRTPGIPHGPARRLVLTFLISLAALAFTPTKWTQHFGVLAGIGAAVLVLGLVTFARAHLGALAAVTATAAVVLSGANVWPYAANWFEPTFSTTPPRVLGVPVSTIVIVGGGAAVLWLAGREAWRRAGGRGRSDRMPSAASVTALVIALALTLQVGGFVKVAVDHPDGYTPAADTLAALGGEPCGAQPLLSVETDPMAGLLQQRPGPRTPGVVPVDIGGTTLPGIAATGPFETAWFELAPGPLPVVVTAVGRSDAVSVEFAKGGQPAGRRTLRIDSTAPLDLRVMIPSGADAVRLVGAGPAARPALVSLPRVPRLTPMLDVLPPGSTAMLDWPVAFLFPCLTPAALGPGTATLPRWRVAPPQSDDSAGITYSPGFGGPFAASRLLVTERRMATFLRGDPMRDAVQLRAWLPIVPLVEPTPDVAGRSVAGTAFDGQPRVPGHDTPG